MRIALPDQMRGMGKGGQYQEQRGIANKGKPQKFVRVTETPVHSVLVMWDVEMGILSAGMDTRAAHWSWGADRTPLHKHGHSEGKEQ